MDLIAIVIKEGFSQFLIDKNNQNKAETRHNLPLCFFLGRPRTVMSAKHRSSGLGSSLITQCGGVGKGGTHNLNIIQVERVRRNMSRRLKSL